jgi:hypothetical protein
VAANGKYALVDGQYCGKQPHTNIELWRGSGLRVVFGKLGTRVLGKITKPVLYYDSGTGYPHQPSPHPVSKRLAKKGATYRVRLRIHGSGSFKSKPSK